MQEFQEKKMWIKLSEWEMIFNDIKRYSGVRLGGFCSAWLRFWFLFSDKKALEMFLEVSNGIQWPVWLLLATWMRHWMMQWTWCTHVHWVSDAIQQSHPPSSPSPPAFNLSQLQVFSNKSVLLFFFFFLIYGKTNTIL